MDMTKAQRLLNKIQAFLDDGNSHELSRLEKDLLKSYVQQLYEAVISDEHTSLPDQSKPSETQFHKSHKEEFPKVEQTITRKTEAPKAETPKTETPKAEPPKTVYSEYMPPVPKTETSAPVYSDYIPPAAKEKPAEAKAPRTEMVETIPPVESKPYQAYVPEPLKETLRTTKPPVSSPESPDALSKLFDLQKSEEMSSRFGHVPIASIESAMGLNERIFTLNELFGGDKGLFDAWCTKLNNLHSFAEARNVLMSGPARDFKWTDPQRVKMAEQFIRIVSRRYPKSAT